MVLSMGLGRWFICDRNRLGLNFLAGKTISTKAYRVQATALSLTVPHTLSCTSPTSAGTGSNVKEYQEKVQEMIPSCSSVQLLQCKRRLLFA